MRIDTLGSGRVVCTDMKLTWYNYVGNEVSSLSALAPPIAWQIIQIYTSRRPPLKVSEFENDVKDFLINQFHYADQVSNL